MSHLDNSLPKPVTTRTVRNHLKKSSYEYVAQLKKRYASARHREQRVAWYDEHVQWTADDWRNFTFSDDSTFYVLRRKKQDKLW
jgi:hypothetical protein